MDIAYVAFTTYSRYVPAFQRHIEANTDKCKISHFLQVGIETNIRYLIGQKEIPVNKIQLKQLLIMFPCQHLVKACLAIEFIIALFTCKPFVDLTENL